MFMNRMSVQNDLIGLGLQASVITNDVIQNNIANVDTPHFKRSRVVFDSVMQQAIDTARNTGVLHRDSITPRVVTEHRNLYYRLDGNNVDIENEMVALYTNSVRFDAMVNMLHNNSRRNNLVYS
ncbi:MAG: flagellar basal body rod protein FlgB [Defluviitaleaceae bacterium]|nr:flagellar basal body rod protein FlgB [Defluviitaleaceae bacterium]